MYPIKRTSVKYVRLDILTTVCHYAVLWCNAV